MLEFHLSTQRRSPSKILRLQLILTNRGVERTILHIFNRSSPGSCGKRWNSARGAAAEVVELRAVLRIPSASSVTVLCLRIVDEAPRFRSSRGKACKSLYWAITATVILKTVFSPRTKIHD